ncbi:MAG: hypothetical protein ACM3MI_05265 [Clostridiales bacterium]
MKKYIVSVFILFFFSCISSSGAQELRHGAFIAPVVKNTSLAGKYALVAVARGGWIINETFALGGGFFALTNDVKNDPASPNNSLGKYTMDFNCGGLELEFIYPSDRFFHASLVMFLGGGGLKLTPEDTKIISPYGLSLLCWEPQLNLEFNLMDWLHLDTGLSYRFISGFDEYNGLRPKDLSGFSGIIELKFGRY